MEGCARIRLRGPANLSDFALHFRPGSSLPDLYVADFGDSYWISHEGSMGEPLTWDISRVMFLIIALYLRSEDRGVSTFDSVHEAIPQSRPCRGPFYLATVDPVTKTLIDVDESQTYHLPNMENVEEDTDLDDDDVGNVLDNELID